MTTGPTLLELKNIVSYHETMKLGKRHRKTLAAIFENPAPAGIPWADIEKLLEASAAEISEESGSCVRIALNDVRAVFHRPHPQKETDRGAVTNATRSIVSFSLSLGARGKASVRSL